LSIYKKLVNSEKFFLTAAEDGFMIVEEFTHVINGEELLESAHVFMWLVFGDFFCNGAFNEVPAHVLDGEAFVFHFPNLPFSQGV
jgi:hypothetical protein